MWNTPISSNVRVAKILWGYRVQDKADWKFYFPDKTYPWQRSLYSFFWNNVGIHFQNKEIIWFWRDEHEKKQLLRSRHLNVELGSAIENFSHCHSVIYLSTCISKTVDIILHLWKKNIDWFLEHGWNVK